MGKYFNKQKDEEEKVKYEYPKYSKEDLIDFEKELEKYKITKNINGKDYTFYNDEKYMIDKKALNSFGAVIIGNTKPILYEVLRDKFDQLYKMQGKREYAYKLDIKNLAENLKVEQYQNNNKPKRTII